LWRNHKNVSLQWKKNETRSEEGEMEMTANEKIALIKEMIGDFYEGRHEGEDAYSAMLGAVFTVVVFGEEERSEGK
jgi:hypothetical protein